jgi:transglutaminase-like putative cysteine protease
MLKLTEKMNEFLESSFYIDWKAENVSRTAFQLSENKLTEQDIVKSCFEFVRDEIKHSLDYKLNPVTCKASDVLESKTGFCFAKSHLLAALLRANHIPSALCYQRVAFSDKFYLHGLNSVFLNDYGWYRLDPRGLKEGLKSEFCPPIEILPFSPASEGETLYPKRWSVPSPNIIALLECCLTYVDVIERLPAVNLL